MGEYVRGDRKREFETGSNGPSLRREERINMARSAFGRGMRYPVPSSPFTRGVGDTMGEETLGGQSSRLIRLVVAAGLFALFAGLCYFDVSFHGYDREWLEQCLQDNKLWEQMTGVVADCINRLR